MAELTVVNNEREWCENVLQSLTMGSNPAITLRRLAKYYYARGCKRKEIQQKLREFVIRCNPRDPIAHWEELIFKCARRANKGHLVEVDGVVVTKPEIAKILGAGGILKQRLLFTMLCLAKLSNASNACNSGWINRDIKDIFVLANVKMSEDRRLAMLHDLYKADLIQISKKPGSMNVKVPWVDNDADHVMYVCDFRNLGNQFMLFTGEDYLECEECGLVVKRHSNRQLYCTTCAALEHRAQVLDKYYSQTSEDPFSLIHLKDAMDVHISGI